MKIGIFGGTFSPVHVEHINMAVGAMESCGLDKLIVVPAEIPPHKIGQNILDFQSRFEMLKIAFNGVPNVEISDFERTSKEPSYTYLTVEHFKKLYPNDELFFLVGTDMLLDFPSWKNPSEILKNATLLVTPRMGDNQQVALDYYYKFFSVPPVISAYTGKSVSSTKIKVYYKLGFSVSEFLPDGVLDYIVKNELYTPDEYYRYIKNTLPNKRLKHTAGVVIKASSLAKRLKANASKAELSALLHDCAKYMSASDFPNAEIPLNVPKSIEHQFLGEYVAKTVLGVSDEEVLSAIRYHSTGKANMTLLEKIVFLADLTEEGRDFDGVEELRKAIDENFDKGFLKAVERTIRYLNESGERIYPLTLECFEYYKEKDKQ